VDLGVFAGKYLTDCRDEFPVGWFAEARLAAGRETVTALATENRLPAENLLPPDALRRLAWEPPAPATPETITAALTGFGARPWQAELTAGPLAEAFAAATEAAAG